MGCVTPQKMWDMLLQLAGQMDIKVRLEPMEQHSGGLCRIKGQRFIFIDQHLSLQARIKLLALSLSSQRADEYHMLPALREYLDNLHDYSDRT